MYKPKTYPDLFKYHQPLRGRAWLKTIDAESRKAFSYIGRVSANFGKSGGKARAATARRDKRGRFVKG